MSELKVGQRVLFMSEDDGLIPYLSYGKVIKSKYKHLVTVDFGDAGVWHCGKGELEPMRYDLEDMGFYPNTDNVCEAFGWGATPEGHTYWADFYFGNMTKEEANVAQAKWDAMKKQWYEEQEAGDCLGRGDSDFGSDLAQSLKEAVEMEESLLVDTPEQHYTPKDIQSIVSDGGPSEYYDFKESHKTLNDWMEDKAKSQWGAYSLHMKDLGKGMCRFGTKNGVTEGYDINKMLYSTIRMKVMEVGKEKAIEYIRSVLEDPQFKV